MPATESQIMTNIIADPAVRTTVKEKHARIRQDVCRVQSVTADAADHIYRLTKLKAHDCVTSVRIIHGTDAGYTLLNVGIWTPSSDTDDPVVIDEFGLVDGYVGTTGIAIPLEIIAFGTDAGDPIDFGKPLWEFCPSGPTDEPAAGTEYEICLVCEGNVAEALLDIVVIIEYTHGD